MAYRRSLLLAPLVLLLLGAVAWVQEAPPGDGAEVEGPLRFNPHYPRIQVSDADGVIWEAVLNAHAVTAFVFAPTDAPQGYRLDDLLREMGWDGLAAESKDESLSLLHHLRHETVLMINRGSAEEKEWVPIDEGSVPPGAETLRVRIAQQLYVVDGHNPNGIEGCIKLSDCRLVCDPY
mgnify:FL=1